ncbi:RING finger protein [Endozoicomonas sp. ALB032]|uniref:RING finger protein n=1 Tax=Endozoicomonas sp. ALB032 TaxID=3403082 RepID=UPI003BB7BE92
MSSEIVPEKRKKNSTGFALPEWPTSTPESALRLSGGGFPPDPPPPPFMPGIPGKGLFNMPDWQFDYLSVLFRIGQRLKQWLYNGYPTTSGQSRPFVSDKDLSAALAGITQKMAFNRSLFSRVPLDASELLAELSGKDLSGHGQMHQPETVMLYPVFMLPQSDSNDFEEAQGVEYVGETCSVCLLNLEQSDDVMKTSCLHLFHLECLKRWLTGEVNMEGNRFCPYCRHDQSALGDFLTWKEIRKGLQEVIHIVMGMLLGRGTWPEDDYSIFVRLNAALFCNNSAIAEQARAIYPLVKLYSAQRLVLQVRAGNRTWPGCEGFIHLGSLRMLVDNPDPAIAKQARAIYPLANLYAVQHQVSQVQAEDEAWNDSYIHTWLGIARDCNDLVIAEQAEALEPLVNYYSVRHLLAQVQAGSETWPDDDRYIYTRLSSAQRSNDRDLAERARAIEPTVHLFSVQHLVLQMQTGTRTCWPEDDNNVYVRLSNAEDSGDPTIAQQARALRPLVDQYKSNSPEN